ncbi:BgTH12-04498, partial [Blumeria graminis f. sp. triticale]
SQAKLPEFVGILQAEWVKPHITQKDTGGKENYSDKVTDLNITIVTWIDNYHQGFIDYMLLEIFREDFVEWDPDRFAMVFPPILRRFKTFLMSRGI